MTRCLFRNIHSLPACELDFVSSNGQSTAQVENAFSEARLRDSLTSLSLSVSLDLSVSLTVSTLALGRGSCHAMNSFF